eukprot:4211989-Prymnesium_polylepis.1
MVGARRSAARASGLGRGTSSTSERIESALPRNKKASCSAFARERSSAVTRCACALLAASAASARSAACRPSARALQSTVRRRPHTSGPEVSLAGTFTHVPRPWRVARSKAFAGVRLHCGSVTDVCGVPPAGAFAV